MTTLLLFNGGKKDGLMDKGHYNAEVFAFFFRYLEKNGVKARFVKTVIRDHFLRTRGI